MTDKIENQAIIDENPFNHMKISDSSFLNSLEGRAPCPLCGKSRKYFCYSCYVPIPELEGKLPKLKLPLKVDIIKHKHEIDGKSTAAHAAVLASDDVTVYTYPDIPNYDEKDVVLIFPSHNAFEVHQLFDDSYASICDIKQEFNVDLPEGHNRNTLLVKIPDIQDKIIKFKNVESLPIKRAIFIDSTWNQSRGIYKDERICRLQSVVLQNRISQFWRHQKGSPRWYLATVEAVHQFLIELHLHAWGLHPDYRGLKNCFTDKCLDNLSNDCDIAYNGQYDNLLFFFRHMYDLIHTYYQHETLYAYKRRLM